MYMSKAKAFLNEVSEGRLLTLPTSIRLCQKRLPITNTLAYFEKVLMTGEMLRFPKALSILKKATMVLIHLGYIYSHFL
jgi:hypothetical protein